MGFFAFSSKPTSDEKYIAKLRWGLLITERMKRWIIPLQVGLLVASIWLYWQVMELMLGQIKAVNPNANPNFMWAGFAIGILLGLNFGLMLHGIVHTMYLLLIGSRSDRLLVKYYDALTYAIHREQSESPPTEAAGNTSAEPVADD